jgi:ubiquinone/menaquinone biosynthesis C-methylase UbiE
VSRHIRLREILAAVQGIALLRWQFLGTDEAAQRRIDELGEILAAAEHAPVEVPIVEVEDGYARWSTTYDSVRNPLVDAEQPAVWELLESAPSGRALDAACGTGRHARRLVELGHEVTGVDQTEEMLALARDHVPEAQFIHADLAELPLEDDSFDLAVCALALEHFSDLGRPIAELARVLRPGGRLILSESHPTLRAVGGAPHFVDAEGAHGVVRSHLHLHSDYLDAFAAAGLVVRRCRELRFEPDQIPLQPSIAAMFPEAASEAFVGFPAVLIWDLAVPA